MSQSRNDTQIQAGTPARIRAETHIRPARADDADCIFGFIRELAEFEKLTHEVTGSASLLRESLFGPTPYAEVLIAEIDAAAVGFALFFHNYSTFLTQPGIYLEDLYVQPAARGRGVGKALLLALARLACTRGCGRLEWAVLDWNDPAIGFYQSLGALPQDEWTTYRLSGDALREAGAGH